VVSIKCENCQREWVPYHGYDRFCCRACSDHFYQAERREAVAYFPRVRDAAGTERRTAEGGDDRVDGSGKGRTNRSGAR
jgi:uncharacterized Zn ribbon protein